jgi:opine dehydrogenase
MSSDARRILVLGSEPHALALAAAASHAGHAVTLATLEVAPSLERVSAQAGLHLSGLVEAGFVTLHVVGAGHIAQAAAEVDLIVVATELRDQRQIATKLNAAQAKVGVLLVPGGVGGALAFAHQVPTARFVAEVPGFPFLGQLDTSGALIVRAIKRGLPLGVVPTNQHAEALRLTRDLLSDPVLEANVLETTLANTNVLIHPPLVLTNWSRVEAGEPFRFYREGLTTAAVRLLEQVDLERRSVAQALGFQAPSLLELLLRFYADQGMAGSRLGEALRSFPPFAETLGPRSIEHRYLTDDVPFGLVPLQALAQLSGVATPAIAAIIRVLSDLSGTDFLVNGRSARDMGLKGLTPLEISVRVGARAPLLAH